jgi:hypothetical protein
MCRKLWLDSLKGRDYWEDIGVGVSIIFKWIVGKSGLGVWIGFMWLRIGTAVAGSCEHGSEPLGFIKCG